MMFVRRKMLDIANRYMTVELTEEEEESWTTIKED